MLKIKTPKSTWFPLFLHMIWLYRTMDGSIWVPGWLWPEVFSSETLMSEYNSSDTFWSEHHSSETFLSLFPSGQRSFLSEYSTKINHMSSNREEGWCVFKYPGIVTIRLKYPLALTCNTNELWIGFRQKH